MAEGQQGLCQPEVSLHHQRGVLEGCLQMADCLLVEPEGVARLAQRQAGPAVLLPGQQLAHQGACLLCLTQLEVGIGLQAAAVVGKTGHRIGPLGTGGNEGRQIVIGQRAKDAGQRVAPGEGAFEAKRELLLGEGLHQVFIGFGFQRAQHHGAGAVATHHDHHALGRDQNLCRAGFRAAGDHFRRPPDRNR